MDVAPVADRPEFLVPQTSTEISEGDENTDIVLSGIELVTVDSGETSHLIIKPEDDNPSELVSILFKGVEIQPNASGNYEISGNVTSDDIGTMIAPYPSYLKVSLQLRKRRRLSEETISLTKRRNHVICNELLVLPNVKLGSCTVEGETTPIVKTNVAQI